MTTYVHSKCHCGLNNFKIAFDTDKLPIAFHACHCNSCRHSTGQLYVNDILIKGVPLDSKAATDTPADLSNLSSYRSSHRGERYFCKRCFAHFFFVGEGKHWAVYTGTLDKVDGITDIVRHVHVKDTLDGGFADHYLTSSTGATIPRNAEYYDSEELPTGWQSPELIRPPVSDELPFYCLCKSITFKLTRATEVTSDKLYAGKNPGDPIRFHATHCLCTDCRLASGAHAHSWITVPWKTLLDAKTSEPLILDDPEKRPRGLKQYESTPGKFREACETCGANVFWWMPKETWLDISVGLVDEKVNGARAEDWFYWTEKTNFPDDALSKAIPKVIEESVQTTSRS